MMKTLIMKEKPSPTIEDYLGVIYTLDRDGEKVIGARLAELLDVSPPTVTATLKRMLRDQWINIDVKKVIHLTPIGTKAAISVIRRHMLTEWLLSRVLNIPWSELHIEADKIEHSISEEVEEHLISTLKDPISCPHGNPMPGQEFISSSWKILTSFSSGTVCMIKRVHELLEDDPEVMRVLEDNLILPGNTARIIDVSPSDKNIQIKVKDKILKISFNVAEKIYALII